MEIQTSHETAAPSKSPRKCWACVQCGVRLHPDADLLLAAAVCNCGVGEGRWAAADWPDDANALAKATPSERIAEPKA